MRWFFFGFFYFLKYFNMLGKNYCVFFEENNDIKCIQDQMGFIPSIEEIKSIKNFCDYILSVENEYNTYRDNNSNNIYAQMESYRSKSYIKKEKKIVLKHIYLIKDEVNNSLKIGVSKNPKERLKQLQISTSNKLTLLYVLKNRPVEYEKELHVIFKKFALSNEWFEYNDCIIKLFKDNEI